MSSTLRVCSAWLAESVIGTDGQLSIEVGPLHRRSMLMVLVLAIRSLCTSCHLLDRVYIYLKLLALGYVYVYSLDTSVTVVSPPILIN
jgi:hypothetical protein